MRCAEVEAIIFGAELRSPAGAVQEHLEGCSLCRDAWKDNQLLRAGFSVMAQDPVPEAMLGFSARVMRRLDSAVDAKRSAAEFFERVGRRFVLASLLLTMSFLLAFAVPSSGPLRGPGRDEPYITQAEPNQSTEAIMLGDEDSDTRNMSPAYSPNGSEQEQK